MKLTLLSLISFLSFCHGALDPRIVRGVNAKPSEIPYQVSLQYFITGRLFCGGIILNQQYVLTAAHCMNHENIELVKVVVGSDLKQPHAVHFIESVYIHKKYDLLRNDIALIKLKTPLKFSTLVSPVVLPKQNETVIANSRAIVSGYGAESYNGIETDKLKVASIRIADQAYCKSMYWRFKQPIFDTNICAYEPTVEKGSCQGDSGGPLTVDGKLVGIVSWGYGCSDRVYPAIYTRVSSYVNWIKKHAV
ncbi:trypsin-1-like [Nylanderia fulva]|uniref:trypsin-1-like n=1 Tax=Nylanderia fulva TaxID=613905 RepID=UPI0010FB1393|nr:trypsin-1-like [Nylanderia fulva]